MGGKCQQNWYYIRFQLLSNIDVQWIRFRGLMRTAHMRRTYFYLLFFRRSRNEEKCIAQLFNTWISPEPPVKLWSEPQKSFSLRACLCHIHARFCCTCGCGAVQLAGLLVSYDAAGVSHVDIFRYTQIGFILQYCSTSIEFLQLNILLSQTPTQITSLS